MPVDPVLVLIVVAVVANLALMAVIVVPPMLGRPSPLARAIAPAVDAERRAAEAGGRRRTERLDRPTTASRPGPTTASSGSSRWVFLLATIGHRRGDRAVARDAAGDLRAARARRPVRRWSSTTCCRPTRSGPAKFVVEGSRRDHGRDAARGPDRRRREPVLLRLPADRRRRGARRRPADHRRPGRGRQRSATSWRSSPARRPGRSVRRPWPRSASTSPR